MQGVREVILLERKPEPERRRIFSNHAVDNPLWEVDRREAVKSKIIIGNEQMLKEHGNRLICPKCERAAFRYGTKDQARCDRCGWEGKSITVKEYMDNKLYGG
jgi:ribosomal protein S27AE